VISWFLTSPKWEKSTSDDELIDFLLGKRQDPPSELPVSQALLPPALLPNIIEPYLFRTYDHLDKDWRIWNVARATSAAPTYFNSIEMGEKTFLDGGIGANNPSFVALREIMQMEENTRPCLFVSIGTGRSEGEGNIGEPIPRRGLRKLMRLKNIFQNYALNSEIIHEAIAFTTLAARIHYHRFNVTGALSDIELDEWKPSVGGSDTLQNIKQHTDRYLREPEAMKGLLNCAHTLVNLRNERERSDSWSRFGEGWEPIGERGERSVRPAPVSIEL